MKWEVHKINHKYEIIKFDEFRKLIEETAELIYSDFCQLQKDSSISAPDNENNSLEKVA